MLISPFLYDYALLDRADRVRRIRGVPKGSRVRRVTNGKKQG
jgi:hypothetical protein